MAERRKIIIQTGAGPDESLPTPHFDAEATLTARPVVPLTDQETYQMHYAARGAVKPFWRRPALLALIVLAAVSVGVAAGFAIGIYRNRQVAVTPDATAPSSTAQGAVSDEVVKPPAPTPTPEQARAAIPDQTEEPVVTPKDEPREPTARSERKADEVEAKPPAEAKPPVVPEKKPVKVDEYTIKDGREESQAEREQRREERRAERRENRRRDRDEEINVPRRIDRAAREVDRIREIFEGRQP
jgi:hypothetical protein